MTELMQLLDGHRISVEATDAAQERQDGARKSVEDALRGRRYRARVGASAGVYVIERVTDHVRLTVHGRKCLASGGLGSQVWDLGEFIPARLEPVAITAGERGT